MLLYGRVPCQGMPLQGRLNKYKFQQKSPPDFLMFGEKETLAWGHRQCAVRYGLSRQFQMKLMSLKKCHFFGGFL